VEKTGIKEFNMRIELNSSQIIQRKPGWLRIKRPTGKGIKSFGRIRETSESLKLATVCEEAKCPNISECWSDGTATFMVMGDTCTRGCRFCSVKTSANPDPLDSLEPKNLAKAISDFNLKYAVITSVDRDEIPDQGANHFKECIVETKKQHPKLIVELLIPDFRGNKNCLDTIIESKAEVIGHNLETVRRLTSEVRDRKATYDQSLGVLKYIKEKSPKTFTKSALMLGLGETEDEVLQAMDNLRKIRVDFLSLGQYLQPTKKHLKVKEFIEPEKFKWYAKKAREKGFVYCAAGPFVRSSYKAGEFYIKNAIREGI